MVETSRRCLWCFLACVSILVRSFLAMPVFWCCGVVASVIMSVAFFVWV